jgi:type IV pilus assembly protein PilM
MLFDTKIKKYAGIDIGGSSLKIVELSRISEKLHLNTYAELMTGSYAGHLTGQTVRLGQEKLSEAIGNLYRESKSSANEFLISVPMSACSILHLSLPKDSEDILDTIVPMELRKYTPAQMDDFMVSFEKLPKRPEISSEMEKLEIIVLSVRKRAFQEIKSAAAILPGEVIALEPSLFGVLRALNLDNNKTSLVIDIGSSLTTVAYLDRGVLYGASTLSMGGQDITNNIQNSLAVSFEEAEKIKKTGGLFVDDKNILLRDILILAARRLSEEVIHIRNRYEMRYNIICNEVWICGGGSKLTGLDKFLQEELKVEVKISNAFDRVEVPEVMRPMLTQESPTFTSAIGLTLSQI